MMANQSRLAGGFSRLISDCGHATRTAKVTRLLLNATAETQASVPGSFQRLQLEPYELQTTKSNAIGR